MVTVPVAESVMNEPVLALATTLWAVVVKVAEPSVEPMKPLVELRLMESAMRCEPTVELVMEL